MRNNESSGFEMADSLDFLAPYLQQILPESLKLGVKLQLKSLLKNLIIGKIGSMVGHKILLPKVLEHLCKFCLVLPLTLRTMLFCGKKNWDDRTIRNSAGILEQ